MVIRQKKEYKIQYYFNAPKSPDFLLIENIWSLLKFYYNSKLYQDKEQVKQRILDIFKYKIEQEWINKFVIFILQRLQDYLSRGGALTGQQ